MSGPMNTFTFQPPSGNSWMANDIDISAPVVTETDTGTVTPFLNGPSPFTFTTSYFTPLHQATVSWGSGHAGVAAAGSGFTIDIAYNVDIPSGADAITGLGQILVVDSSSGVYNLTATETVSNSTGQVVATETWNPTTGSTPITLSQGYQYLSVSITVQASIAPGQAGSVTFSSVQQTFMETPVTPTPAITVDKQISIDGTTWCDVDQGVIQGLTVLAGDKVYERAIITDTGNTSLSNVTVADVNGLPHGFTFSGAPSTSLVAGQSITSDIGTVIAGSGTNYDTATATGTVTAGTTTVTSTDTAGYTGVTPSITIDKQVSLNGTTWQDVGDGILNGPTALTGGTVYERVIVSDTGPVAINCATVTDVNGPTDFTFAGAGTITIGVGQTITSD
ncbi:MAG: hypothetical protein ACREFY_04410, partial [Acetobacteraceae bacterium]